MSRASSSRCVRGSSAGTCSAWRACSAPAARRGPSWRHSRTRTWSSCSPPGSVVYDIVTHPADTPLLQAARAAGFPTIDGLAMLIGQAAAAFEKFFGEPPPRDDGDRALRALLAS